MVVSNDFEKCLRECLDYKNLMTRLNNKNAQDITNGLVKCVRVISGKKIYKNNSQEIYHCLNQLFFVLNGIINNETYHVNLNKLSNELTDILCEVDKIIPQIISEKRLLFLKQLTEKTEMSILLCTANEQNDEKYNFMYHLIFEYKDYEYLRYVNETFPTFFIARRSNEETLFETVLKSYMTEIQNIEYNGGVNKDFLYYQKVLSLFAHNSSFDCKADYIKVLLHNAKNKLKTEEQRHVLKQFINAVLLNNAIRMPNIIYPKGLKQILKEIKKDETGRYDFANLFTCTIDYYRARTYDDALSTKLLDNGNILIINHNADVVYNLNSDLDMKTLMDSDFQSANEYNLKSVSSLNTVGPKNTVSHLFEIDRHGNIVCFQTVKGKTTVQFKLIFSDVSKIISTSNKEHLLLRNMQLLKQVYELLSNVRFDDFQKGYLGARIVECVASLTNRSVTSFFEINHLPYWYRVQKQLFLPNIHQYVNLNEEKISDIIMRDGVLDREILLTNRSKYSMNGIGGFEASSPILSHVTSPIRNIESRIEQGLEHSMLIPSRIKDEDVYLWEEYLRKRELRLLNESEEELKGKIKLR